MNRKHAFRIGILFASIVAFVALSAQAQPGKFGPPGNRSPEDRINWRVGFLDEKLDLNEEQTESIRDILENAQAEAAAWRKDHPDASREDRRAFREEHRATTDAAILGLLSEDQQAGFKELREQRGPHGPGMRGKGPGMGQPGNMGPGMSHHMGPGMRGQRHHQGMHRRSMEFGGPGWPGGFLLRGLARKLELTEEQRGKLTAMREENKATMDAWNKSHPDATWQERITFRSDRFDASVAAISEILTSEQNEKLSKLAAEHAAQASDRKGRGREHGFGPRWGSPDDAGNKPENK